MLVIEAIMVVLGFGISLRDVKFILLRGSRSYSYGLASLKLSQSNGRSRKKLARKVPR